MYRQCQKLDLCVHCHEWMILGTNTSLSPNLTVKRIHSIVDGIRLLERMPASIRWTGKRGTSLGHCCDCCKTLDYGERFAWSITPNP